MNRKILAIFLLISILLSSCGSVQITTASEPQFTSISEERATAKDAKLYATLSDLEPAPVDRIDLAVAVDQLDPATLPVPPEKPLRTYKVGDTRTFWTHNNDTLEFIRISAKLMAISDHAYFWQDEAAQPLTATGHVATPADWTAAGKSFDTSYELVRSVFGREPFPGLDGDPRLFIIHSDSLGMVGGYFGQSDLLPIAIEPHSNEGEYFYISNTWSGGLSNDYYKEVLAHEFQHMIQKTTDGNEEGWLNEGFSMLSQQIAGMQGDNYVSDYLAKPDQSLWYWSSKPSDYGQSYLFVDYLYEQMGQDFIKELAADQNNGLASIDKILTKVNSPRNADDLYADAITAAFFNNPTIASGQYAFKYATIPAMTPKYEFTTLPAIFQGTVEQYGGVDVITLTGNGKVTFTFTGDQRVNLIPTEGHDDEYFWWSNRYDSTFATLTREVDLTKVSTATLNYWAWYDIEKDYDYAYLLVSTDNGTHWDLLPATSSLETDPNSQNLGHGFSGISGGEKDAVWIQETVNLSAYAGKKILLRFAMQNDMVVNHYGFAVDDLSIPEIGWTYDVKSGGKGWVADGFVLSHNEVPQVWRVRVVEQANDGSITIHDVDISRGTGKLSLDLTGSKRLVIFVIGQTRYTTIPASYRVEIHP